jgi:translation initiation factor IF-3
MKQVLKNEEIKSKKVRLVMENGSTVIDTNQAIKKAYDEGLDLLCINMGDIPVVKIGDYSKYMYELSKKEKEAKKNQKQVDVKEIRIGDSIEVNDLKTKAKLIDKFLEHKDKVKLTIRYKGRAIAHINEGAKKLDRLASFVTVPYYVEAPAKILGNQVSMTIVAK